jgi:hypothetical protein
MTPFIKMAPSPAAGGGGLGWGPKRSAGVFPRGTTHASLCSLGPHPTLPRLRQGRN